VAIIWAGRRRGNRGEELTGSSKILLFGMSASSNGAGWAWCWCCGGCGDWTWWGTEGGVGDDLPEDVRDGKSFDPVPGISVNRNFGKKKKKKKKG